MAMLPQEPVTPSGHLEIPVQDLLERAKLWDPAEQPVIRGSDRQGRGRVPGGHNQVVAGYRAGTVVVDTNVFSADLVPAVRPLLELYRPAWLAAGM